MTAISASPRLGAIADHEPISRRAFIGAGVGLSMAVLVPLRGTWGASEVASAPVATLRGFRVVALALPGVSPWGAGAGAEAFERVYNATTAGWRSYYDDLFGSRGTGSAVRSRRHAIDALHRSLTDPRTGRMTQTAINVADIYVPGSRGRNEIDDVVLAPVHR
jgi:hypothetical protein